MNIGIDFGSSSTQIYVQGRGVILDEPTIIAVDTETGVPVAIGNAAYTLSGRTNDTMRVVRPIVGGVVSDYRMAELILSYYMRRTLKHAVLKPNVIISVPSGATSLERHTFLDLVTSSGAGSACLIEESLASAVGVGIEKNSLSGRLLVNMGGGSTDVSVVTMGSIAAGASVKTGGLALDEAIITHLKKDRDLLIGPLTAERLKICLGSAVRRSEELALVASGKSSIDNLPISFEVSSSEIYACLQEQLGLIIGGIKNVLEKTPPELVGDISDNGIVLTGGTSLLRGMGKRIGLETGIETSVAGQALYATVYGAAEAIGDMEYLSRGGYSFRTVHG